LTVTEVESLVSHDAIAVRRIATTGFPVVWEEKDFRYFIEHPNGLAVGIFTSDSSRQLVCYFIALLVAGELDIISVATEPAHQRRGLGEKIIRHALALPEVERAVLEVDVANEPAIRLYGRLGFKVRGVRKGYYEQVRDAYRMELEKPV